MRVRVSAFNGFNLKRYVSNWKRSDDLLPDDCEQRLLFYSAIPNDVRAQCIDP